MAINNGSSALTIGEAATVAEEMPNNEATGLTQTPTQAPPLHTENRIGAADARPPVIVVQKDFFPSIVLAVCFIIFISHPKCGIY